MQYLFKNIYFAGIATSICLGFNEYLKLKTNGHFKSIIKHYTGRNKSSSTEKYIKIHKM